MNKKLSTSSARGVTQAFIKWGFFIQFIKMKTFSFFRSKSGYFAVIFAEIKIKTVKLFCHNLKSKLKNRKKDFI